MCAWLLAAAACASANASASQRLLDSPWRLFESRHFAVATDLDEAAGTALIADLELFRSVVLTYMGIAGAPDRLPTRAIIFAKTGEFRSISNERNTLGFMRPSLRGNRMVAAGGSLTVDQRHILFHEYVHHLLRSSKATRHPTWYDEGLADMLATVYEHDGMVVIGATPRARFQTLHASPLRVPLARIVNEDDLSDWHPQQVSYFYGMAWGLVSYLHATRRAPVDRYLEMIAEGVARDAAFRQAFGATPARVERDVRRYHARHKRVLERFARSAFPEAGEIVSRPMPEREIAYELAFLAMFSNTLLARALLEEQLAAAPDDAYLASALAVTYQAEEAFEEGVLRARAAWRTNPDDPVLAIDLADMLMVWNDEVCIENPDGLCAARYEEATTVYRRAHAAAPSNPEVNAGLAWALEKRGVDLACALNHVNVALDFQPWASYLLLRRGLIHRGLGDTAAARADLERALYWAESDDLRDDASEALDALD